MNVKDWLTQLSAELDLGDGLDNDEVRVLLDVARDAAHGVERKAAPLTTFLLGVAVGRGATLSDAAGAVTRLLPESESGEST